MPLERRELKLDTVREQIAKVNAILRVHHWPIIQMRVQEDGVITEMFLKEEEVNNR